MYVAVKGGEAAIANAHRLLADRRRGDDPERVRRATMHRKMNTGLSGPCYCLGPGDEIVVVSRPDGAPTILDVYRGP